MRDAASEEYILNYVRSECMADTPFASTNEIVVDDVGVIPDIP